MKGGTFARGSFPYPTLGEGRRSFVQQRQNDHCALYRILSCEGFTLRNIIHFFSTSKLQQGLGIRKRQ